MRQEINFDAINQIALGRFESLLSQFLPDGRKVNGEYVAKNPRRNDTSAGSFSISLNKGVWKDFASDDAGSDPVSLWAYLFGVDQVTGARILASHIGSPELAGQTERKSKQGDNSEWTPIIPVPEGTRPPPDVRHVKDAVTGEWSKYPIVARWAYRDASGNLIGYAARVDMPDGSKEVIPQTFCRGADGSEKWKNRSFPKPRPIYNLDVLAKNPSAPVIIFEGEKTADAGTNLIPGVISTTWPGGGQATGLADFSPLKGRTVAIWPDNDKPGIKTAIDIAAKLNGVAAVVKIIPPPEFATEGWDIADPAPEGWDILAHMKTSSMSPVEFYEGVGSGERYAASEHDDVQSSTPAAEQSATTPTPTPTPERPKKQKREKPGFTVLGYDKDYIYIFPNESKQIRTITKGDLTENGLLSFAPLEFWMAHYPSKTGFDKTSACNDIFRQAYERGVFNPDRVRGRGCWRDGKKNVFHLGDILHIDGEYMPITQFESRYIYQAEIPFPTFDNVPAMTNEEGKNLLNLSNKFRWSMPASAALLIGWCVLAPICGALRWRPHIWLTGGAGSGKTTIMQGLVYPLMAGMEIYAQGSSSEAGIRQHLKGDAVPVLFDETEQNTDRESTRMQAVLSLIRQSSSESGARTLKGTSSGQGMNFHIRSMFCLASIQVGIQHQADKERLTVLSLNDKPAKGEPNNWPEIKDAMYLVQRDETLPKRLLRRTVGMLPVVLESIEIFVSCAAEHFGNQRTGDQYGTLLAGAWCAAMDRVPTTQEARKWIEGYDWTDYTASASGNDAEGALRALLDAKLRTQHGAEYTVFEIVDKMASDMGFSRASDDRPQCVLDLEEAQAILQRVGIKVHKRGDLLLSNNSGALEGLVKGSNYAADIRGMLSRLPGVTKDRQAHRIAGMVTKCLSVPLSIFI